MPRPMSTAVNVFLLHPDLRTNARLMIDKHLGKQILEITQMLAVAVFKRNQDRIPKKNEGYYSTTTHQNHPWTMAICGDRDTAFLAYQVATACLEEYVYRYDRIHGCALALAHAGASIRAWGEGDDDELWDHLTVSPHPLVVPYIEDDTHIAWRSAMYPQNPDQMEKRVFAPFRRYYAAKLGRLMKDPRKAFAKKGVPRVWYEVMNDVEPVKGVDPIKLEGRGIVGDLGFTPEEIQ